MTTAVLARSASEIAETAHTIEQAGGRARPFAADVTDAAAGGKAVSGDRAFSRFRRSIGQQRRHSRSDWSLPGNRCRPMVANAGCQSPSRHALCPCCFARNDFAPQGADYQHREQRIARCVFLEVRHQQGRACAVHRDDRAEVKPHRISMFAVGPGMVRTPMAEHSLRSPDGQRWLPWFKRIFDEGLDVPAERSARLVLELASGRADSLSGRFISIRDDLDSLLRNAKQIEEKNLYSLRVQTLDGSGVGRALSAIHADAERPIGSEPQN